MKQKTSAEERLAAVVPDRRGRGRPKVVADERRRADVLACARETFLALGYAGTTMDAVAGRCRMSKQTLYRLFAGKTDLFAAMVAAHRRTMLDLPRLDDDTPLDQAIAEIFRIDIDPAAERERTAFIHLAMMEAREFPEIADLVHRHGVGASRRLLADWLDAQRTRGCIRLDDVASGARMLMDMIFGALMRPGGAPDWPDRAARTAHIRRCIAVFLDGVRTRGG